MNGIWAQATADPDAVALLALRRWYESLSLSSPEPVPGRHELWAWLAGLGALFALVLAVQGPRRALGQLIDVAGHARLLRAALRRFRCAGRLGAILLGTVVITWTISQFLWYADEGRLEDLYTFTAGKSLAELAREQGFLAALTPLRDVCGMGDLLILLVGATILVFKLSADRWGGLDNPYEQLERPLPRWTMLCWGSTWLYAMYRFASAVVETDGLPLGGCLFVEAGMVPLLMVLSDGILLAWVLVELRGAGPSDDGPGRLRVRQAVDLWPAACLACFLALPARAVATGAWLFLTDLPGQKWALPALTSLLRGRGLINLQAAALVTAGSIGAAAWSSGRIGGLARGYLRLLRGEGARLVVVLAFFGALAGGVAALAYGLVLALPRQPWVLLAADSYAHLGTFPVGLAAVAALVELGARTLPRAAPAGGAPPAAAEGETEGVGPPARAGAGAA